MSFLGKSTCRRRRASARPVEALYRGIVDIPLNHRFARDGANVSIRPGAAEDQRRLVIHRAPSQFHCAQDSDRRLGR
jgi:hypothetical protein